MRSELPTLEDELERLRTGPLHRLEKGEQDVEHLEHRPDELQEQPDLLAEHE